MIYHNLFEYFNEKYLTSQNQSAFKPGYSCINQSIFINHEIYQSIDDELDVRGVFLDTFKVFDKVWHDGLIYKLNQSGVKGNFLDTLTNFLNDRKQSLDNLTNFQNDRKQRNKEKHST